MRLNFINKLLLTLMVVGFSTYAQAQTSNCVADIKQVETALEGQKDSGVQKMIQEMLRDARDELNQEKDEAACRQITAEAKKILKLK